MPLRFFQGQAALNHSLATVEKESDNFIHGAYLSFLSLTAQGNRRGRRRLRSGVNKQGQVPGKHIALWFFRFARLSSRGHYPNFQLEGGP